jgi:hypothetical protein
MSEIGKNFSCNNTGKRRKSDFYETPYSITRHLLDVEEFPLYGVILEPSCGNGAISEILRERDYNVIAKDIKNGDDFLLETQKYDAIITNPPFSLAFEFIQKAKKLTNYFALLLPLSYLHGKKRYDTIWTDKEFPLSKIYVFTRYPMLGETLRTDGKYNTGMMVYAWFVWNKFDKETNKIYWIDNNADVLTKEDKNVI